MTFSYCDLSKNCNIWRQNKHSVRLCYIEASKVRFGLKAAAFHTEFKKIVPNAQATGHL